MVQIVAWHYTSVTSLCTSHLYPLLPHLRGWAGIVTFTFQRPCTSGGTSPGQWGQHDGNNVNPTHSPALHYGQVSKCYNAGTAGIIKKVLALHHSPAIPPLSLKVGEGVDTNDCVVHYPCKHNYSFHILARFAV